MQSAWSPLLCDSEAQLHMSLLLVPTQLIPSIYLSIYLSIFLYRSLICNLICSLAVAGLVFIKFFFL